MKKNQPKNHITVRLTNPIKMTNQTQTVSTQTHVNHAKYYQNVSLSKATFYHEIEICFFIFIPCYYYFFSFFDMMMMINMIFQVS